MTSEARAALADAAWLRERYATAGLSIGQIAELLGVGRATVLRALRQHAIETRGGQGT